MATEILASFDGKVFRPEEPLELPPNTRVRLRVEEARPELRPAASFLRTAESLKLDGPPDWSARLEEYLYSEPPANG